MKNNSGLIRIAGLLVLFISLSSCNKTYIGEGKPVVDVREIGKFDKVVLSMNAKVRVTDTTANFCIVRAQENIQEAIVTRIDGNTLVITSRGVLISDEPIEIEIGISQASAFEVNGSGEIIGMNTIKNEEVDFEVNGSGVLKMDVVAVTVSGAVSGSGEATLTGSSNDLNVEINGSGLVDAQKFSTLKSKARISGSGQVKLFVEQSLEANVGGSGIISYRGNATVQKKVAGSGQVIKID